MEFRIGKRMVGDKHPVFIVAELSANHRQDLELAKKSVYAAAEAGADAIKLQTYTPDTITINCDNELFRLKGGTIWDGKTLYELYSEAYTPWQWQPELKQIADSLGIELFSSPFDKTAVDFLAGMDVPAYKIASFEIFDIPLIRYTAAKGKPVILSTGMAGMAEIQEAVDACRGMGNNDIAILKCTSAYPAKLEDANLALIPDIRDRFEVIPGLSDHTEGFISSVVATATGAKIIEKHFILDHSIGGPDASFSLDKGEFAALVKTVRDAESAIGQATYICPDDVSKMRRLGRSLFIVKDMRKGEAFTEENLRSIRPGNGLHPRHLPELLGKHATMDIKKGTPMSMRLVE